MSEGNPNGNKVFESPSLRHFYAQIPGPSPISPPFFPLFPTHPPILPDQRETAAWAILHGSSSKDGAIRWSDPVRRLQTDGPAHNAPEQAPARSDAVIENAVFRVVPPAGVLDVFERDPAREFADAVIELDPDVAHMARIFILLPFFR